MQLSDNDKDFIIKRRRLVDLWPFIGAGLIGGMLCFGAWLWFAVPIMINPWAATEAIRAGSLDQNTLTFMALMLPTLVMAVLCIMVVVLGLLFSVFSNERQLLKIIKRLTDAY